MPPSDRRGGADNGSSEIVHYDPLADCWTPCDESARSAQNLANARLEVAKSPVPGDFDREILGTNHANAWVNTRPKTLNDTDADSSSPHHVVGGSSWRDGSRTSHERLPQPSRKSVHARRGLW
jgi:hypothetical protein